MSHGNHREDVQLKFYDPSMKINSFTVFVCEIFQLYLFSEALVLWTSPQLKRFRESPLGKAVIINRSKSDVHRSSLETVP